MDWLGTVNVCMFWPPFLTVTVRLVVPAGIFTNVDDLAHGMRLDRCQSPWSTTDQVGRRIGVDRGTGGPGSVSLEVDPGRPGLGAPRAQRGSRARRATRSHPPPRTPRS